MRCWFAVSRFWLTFDVVACCLEAAWYRLTTLTPFQSSHSHLFPLYCISLRTSLPTLGYKFIPLSSRRPYLPPASSGLLFRPGSHRDTLTRQMVPRSRSAARQRQNHSSKSVYASGLFINQIAGLAISSNPVLSSTFSSRC
jgi:hypothetical protein